MSKRERKVPKKRSFFIAAAVLILVTLLAWTGMVLPQPGGGKAPVHGVRDIRLGIDIRGGVEAVFTPSKDFEGEVTEEQLNAVVEIMGRRLDNLAIYDREIYPVPEQGRVIVRYPWQSGESSFNPDEALRELGATAQLTFKDPKGEVVLTGADVAQANAGVNQQNSQSIVQLKLNEEGSQKFADATARLRGQKISIEMDGEVLSAPVVNESITGGEAMITGMASPEEAVKLADSINAGALPFSIEPVTSSSISPTLGAEALDIMIMAGIVAFILISIFLLIYYRLPGFVAVLTLWAQALGILLAISIPQQTLTLQGIAGIILSIGMGVDANIIIAERIREEVRAGKTVRNALFLGFDRAFSSILDGNVTVAISAICLMIFGTGSLLSFGYSLLAGVILNLFCGAYLSQLMLRSLSTIKGLDKPVLYGDWVRPRDAQTKPRVSFFQKRYVFAAISGLVILAGLIFSFVKGVDLDIQFKGGTMLTYQYEGDLNLADAEAVIEETLSEDVTLQETRDLTGADQRLVISVAGDEALDLERQTALRKKLVETYPDLAFQVADVNAVDAAIGREVLMSGLKGLLIAAVLIVIYVWFRFRTISGPSAGIFALGALLHDILIAFFVFVFMGKALNETVIAVVLSILGWSVNDTIVIYDRIRENSNSQYRKLPLWQLTDLSIHQTLTRTINTSLASFLAMLVTYIFALVYRIDSIASFALPLMIGIVVGSASSILLVSPFWTAWMSRKAGKSVTYEDTAREKKRFLELPEDDLQADPAAEAAVRKASQKRRH